MNGESSREVFRFREPALVEDRYGRSGEWARELLDESRKISASMSGRFSFTVILKRGYRRQNTFRTCRRAPNTGESGWYRGK